MSDRPLFTYQTRIKPSPAQDAALSAYAALHGRAERALFAAMRAGDRDRNTLKRDFMGKFGLTSRQFNAIRVNLEGKIASIKERRVGLIAESEARIKQAKKVIARLSKTTAGTAKLHGKKRRLSTLQDRLAARQADQAAGTVRLCFGSKKLFRAQFDPDANGYASHGDWKRDWRSSRSNQFYALGSGDETAGNQTCQATPDSDGTLSLTLRLPDALKGFGAHLTLPGITFACGQEAIVAALQSGHRVNTTTEAGKPSLKRTGTAISYRFLKDDQGWRVLASFEAQPVARVSRRELGAIGIDINADHLALAETDRFGSLADTQRFDLHTYGKTEDQAKALIGDVAAQIAALARAAGKPVVLEKLDFAKKKAELEQADPKRARMLSSFACGKVVAAIKSACFRAGVETVEVNPAYTSVIGAVNHAQRLGISVHQGAAFAVARRGLGLSEAPAVREAVVPARNGGHVTFPLPARNRGKHVWAQWSGIRTCLKAAHAAHFRSGAAPARVRTRTGRLPEPAPLRQSKPAPCAHRSSTAKPRGANRQQHCSAGVSDRFPW